MDATQTNRGLRITSALITGFIALTAYGGAVGLIGGWVSFGPAIDARLPLGSLVLAGVALMAFVAVPMTVAAIAAARGMARASDMIFAAGLLLVAWIAIELVFIKTYSWFHPAYLAAAGLVLVLGWLLERSTKPQVYTRASAST
jgi:hypothetical protein